MGDPGAVVRRLSLATNGAREEMEGLTFKSVCVDVGQKRILWDISGHAPPGHVLAIMGPSGSGKTTLLSALAGYTSMSSGSVTLNGQKMTKRVKRQISYVLQADIFFPNLTLKETLQYSALLRLPSELSLKERLKKVDEVIETLKLQECASTLIGNVLIRGLSGGEKKRANIGCELLTDPTLLLLDEPTSGLDSSSALSLLEILRSLAMNDNKTIVTSIHQPSSHMYHMFDGLLLLAKGKVAYFGPAADALTHFSSLGLQCTLHYNPADYMLELVTEDDSRRVLIGEDPKQEDRPPRLVWWRRCLKKLGFQKVEGRKSMVTKPEGDSHSQPSGKSSENDNLEILEYPASPRLLHRTSPVVNPLADSKQLSESLADSTKQLSESPELSSNSGSDLDTLTGRRNRKWPTPWYWQFMVLTVRTFRQSRHIILSKLRISLIIAVAIICSVVWYQVPHVEESITDRYALLFFTAVFWGFDPAVIALMSFPAERTVISKERSSGSYHLSAYYIAKTVSELPLLVILPTIFIIIVYWSAGLNGAASFFWSWFILLLSGLAAQALGLTISATVIDIQSAFVAAGVILLTLHLVAGFYVQNLPKWLYWVQYVSFMTYSFDALLQLEFTSDQHYRCNTEASEYVVCNVTYANNATITGPAVLEKLDVAIPFYANILVLIGYGIIFRLTAYFALRFLHRK